MLIFHSPTRVRTAAVLTLLVTVGGLMNPGHAAAFGTAEEQPTYDTAQVLFADGDHHGAIGELKRFLKTDPNHGAARLLVGRALIRIGVGRGGGRAAPSCGGTRCRWGPIGRSAGPVISFAA